MKTMTATSALMTILCACGGQGPTAATPSESESALNHELHRDYGGLVEETRDPERDASAERLPELCRELIADIDMRRREVTEDGREMGRGAGVVRDRETGREDNVRLIWGKRESGRNVWFASLEDDEGRRRAILAGRFEDRTVRGRVLDRERNVRGVFRGERDGNNLRLRIRLACRDLATEGQRDLDDEANEEAERAADEAAERPEGEPARDETP